LQEHHAEYQRRNIAVFSICPEPPDLIADFVARQQITYPILSDESSRVIQQLGILNTEVAEGDPVYGIPYPGSYLVDQHGIVFEKRFHPDVHVREPMGSLLLYFQLREYSEQLEDLVQERTMQLIETAKLATLGKLIAAINHELNTPLGALANGIDLLWKYLDNALQQLDPRRRAALEEVRQAVDSAYERINQVVGNLRQFISQDQTGPQEVDLRRSLDAAVELLAFRLDGRVEIQRDYAEIPTVRCHAASINQALWELLSNAIDAIEGPGVLTLGARRDGGDVLLTIADTGHGIPAAELNQLFEPRLRPKSGRIGVSLGLPLAHKIIHEHGGRIQVASTVGRGATVTVRLPVSRPPL
jgi:two-component system, NtrC family, sensor kinase